MSPFQGPAGNVVDKAQVSGIEFRLVDRFNRRVVEIVREIPVAKLLDVGCGEGHLVARLVREIFGLHATAIDQDDPELRAHWQALRSPRLAFEVADVCELPFPNAAFQLITAFEVLEHLRNPDEAMFEIRRVCNGWLVASVPWEPVWRLGNIARLRYWRDLGNTPGHVNHWTRRGWRKFLERHGRIDHLEVSPPWTIARVQLTPWP